MSSRSSIPWTELYRPKSLEDVCLDPVSHKILRKIIETRRVPHLLLCGPPGTGKTTVVMNLINALCYSDNSKKKSLTMHLNASDDRGVQVVRNQIENFVCSHALFNSGIKLVVLDEADAMTEAAQAALKLLISKHEEKVRFCLICNYSHKIVPSIRDSMLEIRFRKLPIVELKSVLEKINKDQGSIMECDVLAAVMKRYESDVRSMINEMQSFSIFGFAKSSIKPRDLELLIYSLLKNKNKTIGWHLLRHGLATKVEPYNCCKLLCKHVIDTRPDALTEDYIDFASEVYALPAIGHKVGCKKFIESFTLLLSKYSISADLLAPESE